MYEKEHNSICSSAKCENCGASFKPFNQYCEYCGSERPYTYPDILRNHHYINYEPVITMSTGTRLHNECFSDHLMGMGGNNEPLRPRRKIK